MWRLLDRDLLEREYCVDESVVCTIGFVCKMSSFNVLYFTILRQFPNSVYGRFSPGKSFDSFVGNRLVNLS